VDRIAISLAVFIALNGFVAGCSVRTGAPVIDRGHGSRTGSAATTQSASRVHSTADARSDSYTVRKGDTLFSIALDQGLDYRELAEWNGISDPGVIQVGQTLSLRPPGSRTTMAPVRDPRGVEGHPITGEAKPGGAGATGGRKSEPKASRAPYSNQAYAELARPKSGSQASPSGKPPEKQAPSGKGGAIDWAWPANGKVIGKFNDAAKLKGISIAGKLGQPVNASAAGRVIFSGTGIRGFGKLIVIKHNDAFLSVYAHNKELLVKEGQTVAKGQKIAEMGNSDTDQVKLHFEIRRFGKPVDPLKLLPQS